MEELKSVGYLSLWKDTNPNGEDYYFFEEADKVVVLPYLFDEEGTIRIITLIEPISLWSKNKKEITCVTGTVDEGEDTFIAAVRELKEETGILISDSDKYEYVGSYNFTKSCTGKRHLYIVNAQKFDVMEKPTDGSWFEANTKNMISGYEEIKHLSNDVYLHFLYNYLLNKTHTHEQKQRNENGTNSQL